jgi:hypothetical protein
MIMAGLTETEAPPASLAAAELGAAVDETNERGHPLDMQPVFSCVINKIEDLNLDTSM